MGDYAKAERFTGKPWRSARCALGESHADYAQSLNNLAMMYSHMGDYAKAEPLYRNALEISRRVLGENHPDYALALRNLAGLYYAEGQLAAAEQSGHQSLTIMTQWTQGSLAALGERQRIRLLVAQREALDGYLSIALATGVKTDEIYHHVLAWKGVVEARQDEDRLARDRPELKDTLEPLEQARSRLAQLAFTTPSAGQRQAWRQRLDALRDMKDHLESDLARKSGAFRQVQKIQQLGAAEVAAVLPLGTALVDLLSYVHWSPPWEVRGNSLGRDGSWHSCCGMASPQFSCPGYIPGRSTRLCGAWRRALVAGNAPPMQAAAIELNRRVWNPLKPHFEGATTVLAAPDGATDIISPGGVARNQPGTYLIEDLAIGYVSSALGWLGRSPRRMRSSRRAPRLNQPACWPLAALTTRLTRAARLRPSRHRCPACSWLSLSAGFRSLAGTGPEVRSIARLFDAAYPKQQSWS